MHWDDLRVVRAVYQTGSYAAAARKLSVNETTVPRRLARLERDLGLSLFNAVDGQWRATPACEQIIELSEPIASQTARIASIASESDRPIERRRITATDSVSTYLIAPYIGEFLVRNSDISIEFLVSTANVDFSRWEADIAVRLKRPEKGDFVVSKLMEFDLYYIEPVELPADQSLVCAYPDDLDATPESQFLAEAGIAQRARVLCKNLLVNKQLIQSGNCAGVLPGYMCRDLVGDQRFRFRKLRETRSAWLLLQRHLKKDPTTRTIVDWLRNCAQEARRLDFSALVSP